MKPCFAYLLFLSALILSSCSSNNEPKKGVLVFNEVFLGNSSEHINPDLGKNTPWIELKNTREVKVNLKGYCLQYKDQSFKFNQNINIQPNGLLVIYLDGKEWYPGDSIKNPKTKRKERQAFAYHAKLKIKSFNSALLLFSNEEEIIDKFRLKDKLHKYSYGLTKTQEMGLQSYPTPGKQNLTYSSKNQLSKPINTNIKSGFYNKTQVFSVTSDTSDIYYTLNGTVPTLKSDRWRGSLNITKNTVLILRRLSKFKLPSELTYRSILFKTASNLPKFSLITNPAFLKNDTIGIYCEGKNGFYRYTNKKYANYNNKWKRAVQVQFFKKDSMIYSDKLTMKVSGKVNCVFPLKSLLLKPLEGKEINHPFFNQKKELTSILLRNGGNDFKYTLMRDGLSSLIANSWSEVETQFYQPCELFMNGEFYGVINLREKAKVNYIKSLTGLNPNEFTLLEYVINLKSINGSKRNFEELINDIKTKAINYQEIETKIDIKALIQYYILEFYFANIDWPFNNHKFWKSKNGKWRWILEDCDGGFNLKKDYLKDNPEIANSDFKPLNTNNLFSLHLNKEPSEMINPEGYQLFRSLFEYEKFKTNFFNSLSIVGKTHLKAEKVIPILDSLQELLKPSIPKHLEKWSPTKTLKDWGKSVDIIREFIFSRNKTLSSQITKHFSERQFVQQQFDVKSNSPIHIESIPITESFLSTIISGQPISISTSSASKKLIINGIKTGVNFYEFIPKNDGTISISIYN